ncbi:hypothetical protein OG500_10130 [Kitasatospora sp. NBC_01250]|uniref:hypothetical protein n=1 Tax=Kitasatospora sp. NBC_01250 TaxID=2903571 RepID=UPI002E36BACF|nr:hypothetical protein [Kitasatospora sp. NBC_01250]
MEQAEHCGEPDYNYRSDRSERAWRELRDQIHPGPEWTDAALLVPGLIAAGHLPARPTASQQVPAYRDANPAQLAVFARTIHGLWASRAADDPLPQRARLTEAAVRWTRLHG